MWRRTYAHLVSVRRFSSCKTRLGWVKNLKVIVVLTILQGVFLGMAMCFRIRDNGENKDCKESEEVGGDSIEEEQAPADEGKAATYRTPTESGRPRPTFSHPSIPRVQNSLSDIKRRERLVSMFGIELPRKVFLVAMHWPSSGDQRLLNG